MKKRKTDLRRWKRRRRVLHDALYVAYDKGKGFTFFDLCIALNELRVAFERLSAKHR